MSITKGSRWFVALALLSVATASSRAARTLLPIRAVIGRPRSWSACATTASTGSTPASGPPQPRHDAARARPRAGSATRPQERKPNHEALS